MSWQLFLLTGVTRRRGGINCGPAVETITRDGRRCFNSQLSSRFHATRLEQGEQLIERLRGVRYNWVGSPIAKFEGNENLLFAPQFVLLLVFCVVVSYSSVIRRCI